MFMGQSPISSLADILIVDDEADICELVAGLLQDEGYTTRTARDADSALSEIKNRRPNLLFLDIWLQGSRLDGLQLLDSARARNPQLPVVVMTAYADTQLAIQALKSGARDFLVKPFMPQQLLEVIARCEPRSARASAAGRQDC